MIAYQYCWIFSCFFLFVFTLINFSKLESLYANEMAVGNINTKSGEKVKNYPLLAKVLTSQSTDPVKIRF